MEYFKVRKFMIYLYLIFYFPNFLSATAQGGSTTAEEGSTTAEGGSATVEGKFKSLPKSVQDDIFHRIFDDTNILLSFLNAVFKHHTEMEVMELSDIDIHPRTPKTRIDQPQTIFDIWVTNKFGENYVIEMQRSFEPYQVARFQYYAAQAYCDSITTKYNEHLRKNKKSPKDYQLYRDVPKVIIIVIAEKLSNKPFIPSLADMNKAKKKEDESTYSIYANIEKFGKESKFNFLFIDVHSFKNEFPESTFEKWVHFFKYTKDGKFSVEKEAVYKNETMIVQALNILKETSENVTLYNKEWKHRIQEMDQLHLQIWGHQIEENRKENRSDKDIQSYLRLSDEEFKAALDALEVERIP